MINQIITQWLKKYSCKTKDDYRNALQEIIQEITLEGLARSKFFEKGAFYGGTCLRILYQMIEMHLPGLYYVKSYTLPDLFAGKMSALLAREWKGRVKGRDWYDLVWYIARKIPLHLTHLEARLKQTGHLGESIHLTPDLFSELYIKRTKLLDIKAAKGDIIHFIRNPQVLELWSHEYFLSLLPKIAYC